MEATFFEYTYKTNAEINELITKVLDFSVIEFIVLIIILITPFLFILYFFPILKILKRDYIKKRESQNKKHTLQKILFQREIEWEIEKEIEEDRKKSVSNR